MTRILYGSSEKGFLECEKMALRNIFTAAVFPREYFHVCFINKSNHTVFLVQFEINLHL